MQKITYKDIIHYKKHILVREQKLKEDKAKYSLTSQKVNQPHDKTIKIILDNKEEAVYLINKVLKLSEKNIEIKTEDIEKYNRKFITETFENNEADIIYKMKNKNIFFLIEHQSKIDYSMPYRIMKYSIEIIESAIDNKKITTKDYRYPCVYPIIIYTGEKKWNVKQKFKEVQDNLYETRDVEFTKYNLIDINILSEKELLKDRSFLSKILLIEKSKTEKDLINSLNDIVKIDLSRNEKDFLKRLIYFILKEKLPTKEVENLFKKLEEKEELNMRWMQLLSDAIDKRFEEGMNKGINEGITRGMEKGIIEGVLSIAKKMLEKNMEIRQIQEITGLSKEEIEKLAKN